MPNLLLLHVLKGPCDDPDCEVHNPDVGLAEGVISEADLAFFIAGKQASAAQYAAVMKAVENA